MAYAKKHRAFLNEHRHLYDRLFKRQRGVCAICKRPPRTRRLDMDHDHQRMVMRGLLCHRCNRQLGNATLAWMEAATKYLRKYR